MWDEKALGLAPAALLVNIVELGRLLVTSVLQVNTILCEGLRRAQIAQSGNIPATKVQ